MYNQTSRLPLSCNKSFVDYITTIKNKKYCQKLTSLQTKPKITTRIKKICIMYMYVLFGSYTFFNKYFYLYTFYLWLYTPVNYLQIYLQRRLTFLFSSLLRPLLQLSVFTMAWYTCLSRVMNNKHHPTDVMAGAVIGVSSAFVVVSLNSYLPWQLDMIIYKLYINALYICL